MSKSALFAGLKTIGSFDNVTIMGGDITPEMAMKWEATSPLNRHISKPVVTAYTDSMDHNEWPLTNTGLAFDQNERFIDGHHRLKAIIKHGKPVSMLVFVGLTAEAWDKIDNGRGRTLGERLTMFRPKMTNCTAWASIVSMCAQLTVGQSVLVKTVDDFERWQKLYSDGAAWAIDCFKGHPRYRNASIMGSLAFAFKTDPKRVDVFGRALATNVHEYKSVSWHCERFLSEKNKIASSRAGGTGRVVTVRKVLNFVHAAVEDRKPPGEKALDNDDGIAFFRQAYDTRYAKSLIKPWHVKPEADEVDDEDEVDEATKGKGKKAG